MTVLAFTYVLSLSLFFFYVRVLFIDFHCLSLSLVALFFHYLVDYYAFLILSIFITLTVRLLLD